MKSGTFSKHFQGSRRLPNVMCDHDVLSSTVRELERLHFGTQIGPKRAILSSTSFLRQSRMGVKDTLCRTVWMQTFQESKRTIWVGGILNLSSAPIGRVVGLAAVDGRHTSSSSASHRKSLADRDLSHADRNFSFALVVLHAFDMASVALQHKKAREGGVCHSAALQDSWLFFNLRFCFFFCLVFFLCFRSLFLLVAAVDGARGMGTFREGVACHRKRACFLFTKHLWVRVWSCCLVHKEAPL